MLPQQEAGALDDDATRDPLGGTLPGELRSADQRAPRHPAPRAQGVRRGGGGGGGERREELDLHAGRADRDAGEHRGARAGSAGHLVRGPDGGLRPPDRRQLRDPRRPRHVGLRVRVRDGADEQAPVPRDRNPLHDGEPAVPVRELVAAQGAGALRPGRERVRAAPGRQAATREARQALRQSKAAKRPRSEPQASEGGPPRKLAAIRFGTSGWRGVLGEDFTLPRLRRVLAAVGRWLQEQGAPGEVIVAHDTRPLGDRMARLAAAALREHGQRPLLARGAVPTPVIARAIRSRRARAGLVFTASHNPPEYHGLKLLGASGGSLAPAPIRRIEAMLAEAGEPESAAAARARRLDLKAAYLEDLLELIERNPIARARLRVVYDAMHGAGASVLASALRRSGARVRLLRGRPDPRLGGQAPDPIPERLGGLVRALRGARGLALGIATDGDADRFTAVDAGGRVLSPTQAVALLVDHLARSGRIRRGLALSVATGSLVEKIAQGHGLAVTRHPIGFRLLSERLAAGAADAAADESGGFALGSFSADKDG